ncbi:antibiotic biosynthesis monooxygenase [Burkholderia sp. Bp9143]|uniref:putative quinol monooxygenase n=1 Tax=Burkholderia sp. Bp9143 TaxID=2184574 RepID=UPI000F5AE917|nr:putative quinol monooxygenase [Burkholderia sp. Bp9143]RQR29520.1 antibiotic biosynthesis monooxygenase [Burkholderia sp. Bp9143]
MSAQGEVIVVARWQLGAGAVEEVLNLVADLRDHTLAEPGCLGYDVFRSVANPGMLLVLERYKDEAANNEHRASEHYQELVVKRILPLISDRNVELLQTITPS